MATMTASTGQSRLRPMLQDLVSEATGREGRTDPVLPGTGGPAGNARLTAWTGMVLLALILAELVTLLDVHGMLGWHVAIGALLGPPAVLKTATTSWRLVRYYAGSTAYRRAGPPVTLLRLLGPLVVVSTWLLIGSGVLLVLLGPDSSRTTLFSVLGFRLSWLTVHLKDLAQPRALAEVVARDLDQVTDMASEFVLQRHCPPPRRTRSSGLETSTASGRSLIAASAKYASGGAPSTGRVGASASGRRPEGAGNPTCGYHAAALYSWMRLPSRSRRRTWSKSTSVSDPAGGSSIGGRWVKERCGRCSL